MQSNLEFGVVLRKSSLSLDMTVQKLLELIELRGIRLFALVDHSAEAEKVGMHMNPTKLLIFGSPKAGTPLMVACPTIAIDLPLKILVSEDDTGSTWIQCNSAEYLRLRHAVPPEFLSILAAAEKLAESAAD